MTEKIDWQVLIQKHLDGLTSESEAAALSDQIVTDAKIRTEYLKAARIHGALGDETLAVDLETIPIPAPSPMKNGGLRPFGWPKQLASAVVAGAFVGLLGVGVALAVGAPKSEVSLIPIANGSFETMSGPVPIGFPTRFGEWCGDPAEVIEGAGGNHTLRFLESANVTGKPDGGASACNVFQLVDLRSFQQDWDTKNSDEQVTLELSARFHREAALTDAEVLRIKATCTIHLYQAEPESIGKAWPSVISEAIALGNKAVRLDSGDEATTLSTSCILDPEATIALISVNVNTMTGTKTPIKLGGYFVDDVQLTVIKQPSLPVRFVK
ncbi:MAG: hypothetical protein ACKVJU_16075 [Verrucomicrobiales bacterium]